MPTIAKPQAAWSAIEASFSPVIRAITEWNPCAEARRRQLFEQEPPDAATLMAVEQVDGVLDRGAVGRTGPERREGPESHHPAVELRDHRRMAPGVLVEPLDLLVEGARDHVEEGGGVVDVVVVDGADALGVAPFRRPDHHVPHLRQGIAGVGVAILSRPAPLAQLAEHFHGKEGVYGSSP